MANHGPPAKRGKRDKFMFDSNSDDDDDTGIGNMDTDIDDLMTDDSDNEWLSQQNKHDEKLKRKPLVLKVPRGKTMVPESVKNPGSASVSDKRKRRNEISPEQFNALSNMPLDDICIFADFSMDFKEIALKFFAMKYRKMHLGMLAKPATGGKYTLDSVRRLLRIFGHLIWSLDLNIESLNDSRDCIDLFALVRDSCSEYIGWLAF